MGRPVVVAACLMIASSACSDDDGDVSSATPTLASSSTTVREQPSGGWRVRFVADGDSFEAVRKGRRRTVRLLGVNAPEVGECGAGMARRDLSRLLAGGPVTLVRGPQDRDRFGRLLRYVESADTGDVGAKLVERGLVVAVGEPPDVPRADRYERLERRARRNQRGVWADGACTSRPGPSVTIRVHADAEGADDRNLGDEWVTFINRSGRRLDLDKWTVADESTFNRYRFVDTVLAPGASVRLITGCGDDRPGVRHWCQTAPVWNNGSDTVFLRDPSGANVAVLAY